MAIIDKTLHSEYDGVGSPTHELELKMEIPNNSKAPEIDRGSIFRINQGQLEVLQAILFDLYPVYKDASNPENWVWQGSKHADPISTLNYLYTLKGHKKDVAFFGYVTDIKIHREADNHIIIMKIRVIAPFNGKNRETYMSIHSWVCVPIGTVLSNKQMG